MFIFNLLKKNIKKLYLKCDFSSLMLDGVDGCTSMYTLNFCFGTDKLEEHCLLVVVVLCICVCVCWGGDLLCYCEFACTFYFSMCVGVNVLLFLFVFCFVRTAASN